MNIGCIKHHSAQAKQFYIPSFIHYLFLTYTYINYTILTKITIYNFCGVKTTQAHLYLSILGITSPSRRPQ